MVALVYIWTDFKILGWNIVLAVCAVLVIQQNLVQMHMVNTVLTSIIGLRLGLIAC